MLGHQTDVFKRGQVWKQSAILDDVTHPAPHGEESLRGHRFPFESDRSGIGLNEADQDSQHGALAAPAGADEYGGFTHRKLNVGGLKDLQVAKGLRDVFQCKHRSSPLLACGDGLPVVIWNRFLRSMHRSCLERWCAFDR